MENCPNYQVNLTACPCTSETCARKGFCCLCIANHRANGNLAFCMRPESLEMSKEVKE